MLTLNLPVSVNQCTELVNFMWFTFSIMFDDNDSVRNCSNWINVSYGISLILFLSRISTFKLISRLIRFSSSRLIVFPKRRKSKLNESEQIKKKTWKVNRFRRIGQCWKSTQLIISSFKLLEWFCIFECTSLDFWAA